MRYFKQLRKNSCGQTCLAVATGITYDEAVKLIGHQNKTSANDLIPALRSLGFNCADRLFRAPKDKRGWGCKTVSIMRVAWKGSSTGHWIVNNYGEIWDPGLDISFPNIETYEKYIKDDGKIVSSLRVGRRKEK